MTKERARRESARAWGYWTKQKLAMLAEYLPKFTTASKTKAPRTLYLDLFAGQHRNLSRETGEEISGSPRVALDAIPAFSKVVLFELPGNAKRLEADLRTSYPGRDLEVIAGDCNQTIGPVLQRLGRSDWQWSPTFALVDQQAAEIKWSTLEALAKFRTGKFKVELWLLFAPSMLPRGLASVDHSAVERFEGRIRDMYGNNAWRELYEGRNRGLLTGSQLRDELLNLFRWRLEKTLGYKVTHHFEMKNTRGVPLYNMVFATDNDAGERIMRHIYGTAAAERPHMQAEAAARRAAEREEESDSPALFPAPPKEIKSEELYQHRPPTKPWRLPD